MGTVGPFGYPWVPMGPNGYQLDLINADGSLLVRIGAYGTNVSLWLHMGTDGSIWFFDGPLWVPMCPYWYYRSLLVLMGRVLLGPIIWVKGSYRHLWLEMVFMSTD
jgi:hypothetical protein